MNEKQGLILIVDDNEDNLVLLERILVNQGYAVIKAANGEMVESMAHQFQPDLILMDIHMPGEDGYSVCRKLKAQPQTGDIPVIFVSALDSEADKLKGFEAGGVDYICKPFEINETMARVKTHVTTHQLQKQLQQVNTKLTERESEFLVSQKQLSVQENKLSALIDSLPNLTFVYDEEGHYLEIMGNETNYLFTQAKNMLGKKIVDLLPPATAEVMMEAIRAVLKTGNPEVVEYQLPVVSGETLWFEGRIAALERNQQGKGRVIFVASEITERVENYQQIEALAVQDPLTNCVNRRHFTSLAEKEVQRAIRYDRSLSLLILDIDHFKEINDRYGHQTGDQVLRQLVDMYQKSLRNIDILGRYGGDEFVILLPETDDAGGRDVAERIRHETETTVIDTQQGPLSVTVSVGVACLQALDNQRLSLDHFIEAADKALYQAKTAGRNCIRTNCQMMPVYSIRAS